MLAKPEVYKTEIGESEIHLHSFLFILTSSANIGHLTSCITISNHNALKSLSDHFFLFLMTVFGD